MLVQYLPQLAQKRIILASASPRRKELLSNIGIKFEVINLQKLDAAYAAGFGTLA